MPYLNCPSCAGLAYVPRSHVHVEPCPVCGTPLYVQPLTSARTPPRASESGVHASGNGLGWPAPNHLPIAPSKHTSLQE